MIWGDLLTLSLISIKKNILKRKDASSFSGLIRSSINFYHFFVSHNCYWNVHVFVPKMNLLKSIHVSPCKFHPADSGFQSLSLELGFWIPIVGGIPDSLSCIPDSTNQDSWFHGFPGFWNPLSLTWSKSCLWEGNDNISLVVILLYKGRLVLRRFCAKGFCLKMTFVAVLVAFI